MESCEGNGNLVVIFQSFIAVDSMVQSQFEQQKNVVVDLINGPTFYFSPYCLRRDTMIDHKSLSKSHICIAYFAILSTAFLFCFVSMTTN